MAQNLTVKQQKLVLLLKNELSKQNGAKSLRELMILAGYSPETARNPSEKVLEAPIVKKATEDFVDMLDDKARMAFGLINEKKLTRATPRDVAYVGDIMVKNKQLLSGNATERQSIVIEISEEIARKNS